MRPIDVRLEQVGKQYRVGPRRAADSFWALEHAAPGPEGGALQLVVGVEEDHTRAARMR